MSHAIRRVNVNGRLTTRHARELLRGPLGYVSHLLSFEISSPFGAVPSLPGASLHPVPVWYCHTSPVRPLVAAKPPSGSSTTLLKLSVESAGAHPTRVKAGAAVLG